jgi:hypothetical protein
MASKEAIWHVTIEDEQRGPLTKAQVLEYLRDGMLIGSDLVWRPGFTDWKSVNETADFWEPPRRTLGQGTLQSAPERVYDDNKTEATPVKPANERWSLWRSANFGLLVSALVLAVGSFDERGFQHASYAQTASAETIFALLGEIMAGPLIFVLVALTRNRFYWRQPKSSASALRGALTFAFLLGAIAVALKLHAYVVFSSSDAISGAAQKKFVEGVQRSCMQKQRSLVQGQNVSEIQIAKYCTCTAEKMAASTSYKELGVDPDAKALDYLKQRAEAAGVACRGEALK